MSKTTIVCLSSLNSIIKQQAVEVFVAGFRNVFRFANSDSQLTELFLASFDYSLVYVCLNEDKVVGILGLGTNKKRVFHFDKDLCQRLFGKQKGWMIYQQLRMITETPAVKNDTDLYIDYLATDQAARGKGVATKLLNYAFDMPQYTDYYIEVLSKNVRARQLYEYLGFCIYKKSYNFFTIIQGLGYTIKLKKTVNK